jgi:hypothetical protein
MMQLSRIDITTRDADLEVPPSNPSAMLPATTPTRISINATETPVQIDIKLPTSASPIQIAAINQMLFSINSSPCYSSL